MALPSHIVTREEAIILFKKIRDRVETHETLLLCPMQTEGWEIVDFAEKLHIPQKVGFIPGKNYYRCDIYKDRENPYVFDDEENPNKDNAYAKVIFPDNLPDADVAACIDDFSHSWKSKAGFYLEASRRGYRPMTFVIRDRSGVCDDCIYPEYTERIHPVEWFRLCLPQTYKRLVSDGLLLSQLPRKRKYSIEEVYEDTLKELSLI